MEVKHFEDFILYLKQFEIQAIGNKMVNDVKKENKHKGIPLVYSIDGLIVYELADGTVTLKSPFKNKK